MAKAPERFDISSIHSPGILSRLAGGFGGITGAIGGLFSTKLFLGMVAGAFLVMGGLLWKAGHDRDVAQGYVTSIGNTVAEALGVDKLQPKQIVPAIQEIATRRDVYKRERDNFSNSLRNQSNAVVSLQTETRRLRQQSNENLKLAQSMTRQRDGWIRKAKEAATRTERLSAEEEIKRVEEVLDALYENGF